MKYDLLIIGGAAAGLTAGLYAARRALKTLVISKDLGGQVSTTPTVENYPGFIEPQGGYDLMERFKRQAEKWGAAFKLAEITSLKKKVKSLRPKQMLARLKLALSFWLLVKNLVNLVSRTKKNLMAKASHIA